MTQWLAGGLVLGGFAFLAATWRLFRFIFRVDRALPTLLNIAQQFESNSGSTLRDKIEHLYVEHRVVLGIAEDTRTVAQTNAAIVNELSQMQSDELTHVREYLQTKLHEIANNTAGATYVAQMSDQRTARLEARLDALLLLVPRPKESDP